MSTFCHEALGCKVNQYDAERARRHLLDSGFQETDRDAALVLLASCTVTGTAAAKSRHSVRSLVRRHPRAEVAVMGCMTEADRQFYESLGTTVTILPSARDDGFLAALRPMVERSPPPGKPRAAPAPAARRRTRAFLKVEDGCDLSCSFCIIPSVRGRARSRPAGDLVRELDSLLRQGIREVVITGVHLGHFGRRSSDTLCGLLRDLARLPGDYRLRLSSLEVSELNEPLLRLVGSEPRVVPHLHLPLQSGSPEVLRRMRRPYTAELFRMVVREVRQRLDQPALTTDVIAGFPAESDGDFERTLDLCRECGFSKIHFFPFSARSGTEAAGMAQQVAPEVIRDRRERLLELEGELRKRAQESRIGKPARVLVERREADGSVSGFDERYHRVRILNSLRGIPGEFEAVIPVGIEGGLLIARPGERS